MMSMDGLTPPQRIHLQLDVYAKALAALREAVQTDTGDKKSRDSILLSYVFTFEMAVRSLAVVLKARGLNPPDVWASPPLPLLAGVASEPQADRASVPTRAKAPTVLEREIFTV